SGFWIPDASDIRATAKLLLENQPESGTGAARTALFTEKPVSENQADFSKVTIEVWNASSKKGLALEVVRGLREAGFDVVKWGNYNSRQQRTLVRDHKGDT